MTLLWRDSWLKPLTDGDVGTETCASCKKEFGKVEFVTSCDFCDIGVMHDQCANKHILQKHRKELESKMSSHKDKPLHDYQ
ncbi:hypothetical protein [Candidatus Nitrososphaera sp. FF02]|uniref:hypothetical protein n=1 Tax=Candidatus Nitrososphaera sp. FF02 TaxID=3398226 RepID=UPI0039EAC377